MLRPIMIKRFAKIGLISTMISMTFLFLLKSMTRSNNFQYFETYSSAETKQMCAEYLESVGQLYPDPLSINCKEIFRGNFHEMCRGRYVTDNSGIGLQPANSAPPSRIQSNQQLIPAETLLQNRNKISCENFTVARGYPLVPENADAQYPIAFSVMAHRNFAQLERLLRMIYAPQNIYCIHVDAKYAHDLAHSVRLLSTCLPNIFLVTVQEKVAWGGFGVLRGTLNCLEDLVTQDKTWKYFINLSGLDFPLKTNHEIVQYLQSLKGYSNAEVKVETKDHRYKFQYKPELDGNGHPEQILRTNQRKSPPPHNLVIYRGNLAGIFPRSFAEWALNNEVAKLLADWLSDTYIPDEHFWATLLGNRGLGAPGGLPDNPAEYLARYAVWKEPDALVSVCRGKYVHDVCIFGVEDLLTLVQLPHLFVNKLHQEFESSAFDCLEQRFLDRRRKDHQRSIFGSVTRTFLS